MASEKIEVTLSLAEATDLPALAEMNRLAYMQETISMIAFKNWPDETNMFNFFQSRIQQRMESPNTQIFKATTVTGEVVGFICWTLEPEKVFGKAELEAPALDPNGPTGKAMAQMESIGSIFNMEFIKSSAPEMQSMSKSIKGMKHYCGFAKIGQLLSTSLNRLDLSTFVVTPRYQGRGIGSELLGHCLEIADRDGLPTWLSSFPGSHHLYLRFGFEDVEYTDLDLNKWDHYRFRGFGIYRQYSMVRQPRISDSTTT